MVLIFVASSLSAKTVKFCTMHKFPAILYHVYSNRMQAKKNSKSHLLTIRVTTISGNKFLPLIVGCCVVQIRTYLQYSACVLVLGEQQRGQYRVRNIM